MKASKIFLLLGILGLGTSVETAWQARAHFGVGPLGWIVLGGKFRGPHFDYVSTETREVPAGTAVEIENSFGAVDVKPGAPGRLLVTLQKVIYLPNEAKARELADKLKIDVRQEAGRLRVTTNRGELDGSGGIRFGWSSTGGFETNLSIEVPPETAVSVKNGHGRVDVVDVAAATVENSHDDVRVERVKGVSKITVNHGDLVASSLGGDAEISVRHGDLTLTDAARVKLSQAHGDVNAKRTGRLTVEIEHGDLAAETVFALEVRGQHAALQATGVIEGVDVETSYDDVTLSGVGGDVRAKVEHGGVKLSDVKGTVVAESSFDDTRVSDVSGAVEASVHHGGFTGKRLGGGAQVKAEGDDIVLEGFRGAVRAEAKRGSVRLVPDGSISEALYASAAFGDVRLQVPDGSRFDLAASVDQGDLDVELPGLAVTESGKRRIAGKLGEGGARVQLEANHGDVVVSAGSPRASTER